MENSNDIISSELIKKNGFDFFKWLYENSNNFKILPRDNDINWQLLAENSSLNAYLKINSEEGFYWANTAIFIKEKLSEKNKSFVKYSLLRDTMFIRAWYIKEHGILKGDSIRDIDILIMFILDNLPFSLEIARKHALELKNKLSDKSILDDKDALELLKKLRFIKNNLLVVKSIINLVSNKELLDWFNILEDLP